MNVSRRPLFALLGVTLGAPILPAAEAAVAAPAVLPSTVPDEVFYFRYPVAPFTAVQGSVTLNEVPMVAVDELAPVPLFEHPSKSLTLETMVTGSWHGIEFRLNQKGEYLGHRLIPTNEPHPTQAELSKSLGEYFMARFFRFATVDSI